MVTLPDILPSSVDAVTLVALGALKTTRPTARVSRIEGRLDGFATKADIARLEGLLEGYFLQARKKED